MKKKIILIAIVLIVAGLGTGLYLFNKPHADMESLDPVAVLSASELFEQYSIDELSANEKYLGKVIEVSGTLYSIEKGSNNDYNVLLMEGDQMFGVACNMVADEKSASLKVGQQVTLKGECSGMLSDVVMIRCIIN